MHCSKWMPCWYILSCVFSRCVAVNLTFLAFCDAATETKKATRIFISPKVLGMYWELETNNWILFRGKQKHHETLFGVPSWIICIFRRCTSFCSQKKQNAVPNDGKRNKIDLSNFFDIMKSFGIHFMRMACELDNGLGVEGEIRRISCYFHTKTLLDMEGSVQIREKHNQIDGCYIQSRPTAQNCFFGVDMAFNRQKYQEYASCITNKHATTRTIW